MIWIQCCSIISLSFEFNTRKYVHEPFKILLKFDLSFFLTHEKGCYIVWIIAAERLCELIVVACVLNQDEDGLQPSLRNNLKVVEDLASWQRLQKSQAILMEGMFIDYSKLKVTAKIF